MKIISITVISGHGPDHIFLNTDLREATWPYEGKMSFKGTCAEGNGLQYAEENFSGVPIKYIDTRVKL